MKTNVKKFGKVIYLYIGGCGAKIFLMGGQVIVGGSSYKFEIPPPTFKYFK